MSVRALRRGSMAGRGAVAAAIPTWVASNSGGVSNADTVATTRPVGTAAADMLVLAFHAQPGNTTPPTLTGWTKLSGYDVSDEKFAIYSRIADLTATDTPTVDPGPWPWYGGWTMTAVRGASTVSVTGLNTNGSVTPMVGPVITTTVPNSLILSVGLVTNPITVSAPTGGPVDRYRSNGNYWGLGVATEDMAVAGAGHAASWVLSGAMFSIVYGLALAP